MALLLIFLIGFSLATGALEAGRWNNGWHLSAIDTQGDCRLRLIVYPDRKPDIKIYR